MDTYESARSVMFILFFLISFSRNPLLEFTEAHIPQLKTTWTNSIRGVKQINKHYLHDKIAKFMSQNPVDQSIFPASMS